jgi:hypothetical protein
MRSASATASPSGMDATAGEALLSPPRFCATGPIVRLDRRFPATYQIRAGCGTLSDLPFLFPSFDGILR